MELKHVVLMWVLKHVGERQYLFDILKKLLLMKLLYVTCLLIIGRFILKLITDIDGQGNKARKVICYCVFSCAHIETSSL